MPDPMYPLPTNRQSGDPNITAELMNAYADINDLNDRLTAAQNTITLLNDRAPLRGSGSPEGQVSAPPGRMYVDNAMTLGAWVWQKVTGTGTTGWRVVYGDTGWRQVSGSLINGWTATNLLLRRVSDRVTVLANLLNGSAKTGNDLYTPPAGFSIAPSFTWVMPISDNGTFRQMIIFGGANKLNSDAVSAGAYGEFGWNTTDPWPTALGTAYT